MTALKRFMWEHGLTSRQRRQPGSKSKGRGSGSKNFRFFQANFREISIIFFWQFHKKFLFFQANFPKNFDFFRHFYKIFRFSRQNLPIYSYFWANYSRSLQKSPLLNILPVHDKI